MMTRKWNVMYRQYCGDYEEHVVEAKEGDMMYPFNKTAWDLNRGRDRQHQIISIISWRAID